MSTVRRLQGIPFLQGARRGFLSLTNSQANLWH